MKRLQKSILLLFITAIFFSCSDTKPKVLGNRKLDLTSEDSDATESFSFNFAYRDSAAAAPLNRIVYLQGASNTKSTMTGSCNAAGTNCVCDFLDSSGSTIESTDSSEISYDTNGNYFRCEFDGVLTDLAKVKIRNLNGNRVSESYNVETSLTAQKILGGSLNINLLRYVYSYTCLNTYLQKAGTTTTSFDCSNQATTCNGTNFCFLQSAYPFYLYKDGLTSNFVKKKADELYNGASDSTICGLQIKKYDCATYAGSTPSISFGLYAEQKGIWEIGVSLGAAPGESTEVYGFAARTSTFQGNTVCPPGLERKIFYRATPNVATLTPSHNYPTSQTATVVESPTTTPSNLAVNQIAGGRCNGTTCTTPTILAGNILPTAYSSTGETEFCVIPSSSLP